MSHVLVLIADPAKADLHDSTVAAVRAAIAAEAATWLAPGIACEFAIGGDPQGAAEAARNRLGDAPVDVAVVSTAHRRKRLLVADMESTLVENEFLDDIAARIGIGPKVADITRRAMAGELDFAGALRERVAMLAGHDAATLDAVYAGLRLMPGVKTLIATMRRHGTYTAIVSGGFSIFVERVRTLLGADHMEANHLGVEAGRLTGKVREPIFDRAGKRAVLQRLSQERSVPMVETMAVGDGANDLDMVKAAGLGVAFRAKPVLAAAAGASIRHGDLTALLYLQGYRQAEFAG